MRFDEIFVLVDSLELEQPSDLPIAGISSLDISPGGEIVVTDSRQARVSLFSPSGELRQVIGRRGQGPGEFSLPMEARFDQRGAIHVLDLRRLLISIFSPSGELQRDILLPSGLHPSDMEVVGQGEYWVGGRTGVGGRNNVVFQLDSLGDIAAEYMPLADARPRGQPDHPAWTVVRETWVTMGESGPFVSVSLLDSAWAIDEISGEVRSWAIPPEGYVAPTVPDGRRPQEWVRGFQRATGILGDDTYLLVPFVAGVYYQAERSLASYRDSEGAWHTLLDTPVLLRNKGSVLIAFARPVDERVVVNIFERR